MATKSKLTPAQKEIARAKREQYNDLFDSQWSQLAPNAPKPIKEYRFAEPDFDYAFDRCFPEFKVAIEIDGGNYKAAFKFTKDGRAVPFAIGRHTQAKDHHKHNLATAMGWRVFHVLPEMLKNDPVDVVHMILYLVDPLPFAEIVNRKAA